MPFASDKLAAKQREQSLPIMGVDNTFGREKRGNLAGPSTVLK